MSLKQLVFVILAVAAVVFGVTFVKLYLPSESTNEVGWNLPPPPTAKLRFPLTEAHWGKREPGQAPEFEVKKSGSYAFWFENPNDAPVQLGVSNVTCKCSHLDVCIWPGEWKAYPGLVR